MGLPPRRLWYPRDRQVGGWAADASTFTESIWNACSRAASLRRRPTEGLDGLGPNPCEATARRRASDSESMIDLDSFISTLRQYNAGAFRRMELISALLYYVENSIV